MYTYRRIPYVETGLRRRIRLHYPRLKTVSRSTSIVFSIMHKICFIYTGKQYRRIELQQGMYGTKLGEYAQTKRFCVFRRRKKDKYKKFKKR